MNLKALSNKVNGHIDIIHRSAVIKAHRNRYKKFNDVLNKDQRGEIKQFYSGTAHFKFGAQGFYTSKTGTYSKEYIPDELWYGYILPFYNNQKAAIYMDNKCFYPRMFPGIKQPETILIRENGLLRDSDYHYYTKDEARDILSKEDSLFVKQAIMSYGGHGVTFFEGNDVCNKVLEVVQANDCDYVIQKPIRQHSEMAKLNQSSVNTVRVCSLLSEGGGVKVYSVITRMGINGSKVDNASSGGITCGVHTDGQLKGIAFDKYGNKYESHPDTGLSFDSIKIPSFEKVCELAISCHYMIPHFRLVSWDIAIDKQGDPILIEANLSRGELDFHQLNNGPIFGGDTSIILDEVFKR